MCLDISVIIPVYNAERYVRRAVESAVVLAEVSEIILVDDAGPDNAYQVCQQLDRQYPKVRLLRHPDNKNHGPSASRNLGVGQAKCDYIAFLDADDYYLSNRFEAETKLFSEDPSIDGVYGGVSTEFASEQARAGFLDYNDQNEEFITVNARIPPEQLVEVLLWCHTEYKGGFHTNGITFKKKLLQTTGLFNPLLRLREDIHLWVRMASVGNLMAGIVEKPIAVRCIHGQNSFTNAQEQSKYIDYWWRDLNHWFRHTCGVPKRARRAFEKAYCRYRVENRNRGDARIAILTYTIFRPRIILDEMGFFDLFFLKAFGRSWLLLHFISGKNKILRKINSVDKVK